MMCLFAVNAGVKTLRKRYQHPLPFQEMLLPGSLVRVIRGVVGQALRMQGAPVPEAAVARVFSDPYRHNFIARP